MTEETLKKIRSAIEQAAGNVQLEDMNLNSEDLSKIESILARYRNERSEEALNSLLFDLVQAVQLEDERIKEDLGSKNNGKLK